MFQASVYQPIIFNNVDDDNDIYMYKQNMTRKNLNIPTSYAPNLIVEYVS